MHVLALLVALFIGQAQAAVRVVATIPDLAAIAKEVVGPRGTVTAMALPTQDPHFVDAKPSLAVELSRADLLVLAGSDLEIGWLPNLLVGARNPKVQVGGAGYVDCSTFVRLLDVPAQKVDRAMGDVHPAGNPHYLWDPRQAIPVARGIAARLGSIDAENAAAYASAADDFARRVEQARPGWESALSGLRGKEVVSYHRSLSYLAAWLGFTVPITVEPKPGIPPTPSHVASVINLMKAHAIRVLLQEEFYPSTTADLVQQQTGAKLVRLRGGADFAGGESYIARIERTVNDIRSAL